MTVTYMHPEQRCQECGERNPPWSTDSDRWNAACRAAGIDRGAIMCPTCFVSFHEAETGLRTNWTLQPGIPFVPLSQFEDVAPPTVEESRARDPLHTSVHRSPCFASVYVNPYSETARCLKGLGHEGSHEGEIEKVYNVGWSDRREADDDSSVEVTERQP